MPDKTDIEKINDKLSVKEFITFLEYEEALTKDKETAQRIRNLLKKLGLWE